MKKIIQTGLVATMLVAIGCSDGSNTPTGGSGGTAGNGSGGAGGGAAGKGGAGGASATGGAAGGAAGGVAGAAGGVAGSGGGAGGLAGSGGSGGATAGSGGAMGGSGGATGGSGGTPVPAALVPPMGATPSVQYHGVGTQIYTCTASGGADAGADAGAITYAWVFKAPDAKLYDSTNTQVGTHGAGPEWTASDGSIVNGVKAQSVNAPASTAIPWLLLRASSTTGTGVFKDVTYVQRLNTTGGVAPAASGCNSSTAGMESSVAYTADYLFFKGGGATSWLNAPSGVPAAIAAPAGTTLAIHDKGIGTQVYTCTAGTGGAGGGSGDAGATSYSWVLLKPDAILYDATYTNVGTHGMGPAWTSSDGSIVNGSKLAGANGTTPATDVPWLLLKASSTTGTGVFTNISFIQRLNTAGGQAPTTGCSSSTVGTMTSVLYSADYYFYTGTPTDGGTGG
jgi:hypothetical protein